MGLQLAHLTVLLWVLLSANAKDCAYKGCDCSYMTTIDCGFLSLTQMPPLTNASGAHGKLVLSYNTITEIPANSLPLNLSEIDLNNNPTTIIADTAFDGSVYTLQSLDFTLALFTRIPNALGHLRALASLTIQDVNVRDWNDEALGTGGQTLTSLNLANVSLISWPNWIQNFTKLTELIITQGSIPSIPDGALDTFATSLTILDLSDNILTSIPKALSKLSALTSLDLQQNNIIDITWFPKHSPLTQLYININKISNSTSLSDALRQMGNTLNFIAINSNQLAAIPDFSSLTKITDMDFSSNKISDPNSGSILPIITSIDFSYNFLPAIPRFVSTLHQTTTLTLSSNLITSFVATDITPSATLLDISYNQLTELTDNSFPHNCQLKTLNLNNNPIVTIHNMAFTNLPFLTELYMRNARITRLPLALRSLNVLSRLEMNDSNGLVCTCMEKSLASWIVNLSSYMVLGNCGVMSIYDFLIKLSPECPA